MSNDAAESWLKFVNPDTLKENLTRASLYLTCWELLKQCFIEQLKNFYTHDIRDGEWIPGPDYKTKVLALHKDQLLASAIWFKEHGAISDADIESLRELRSHRNLIAHELPKILSTKEHDVKVEYFDRLLYLVHKIDKWWIKEIEIPTNPEFDNRTFTDEEFGAVQSSTMIVMGLLLALVKGQEKELRSLHDQLKAEAERRGWSE